LGLLCSDKLVEGIDLKRNEDIEVLSGQLVAHSMMLQMLIGQAVLHGPDQGAELRHALQAGLGAIRDIAKSW
jgi:hypothetical protein